ncbi:MAG: ABC transporter ATP-binding protein [Xanthomonadales bacterium]|jgi:ABC-2 type transport system ATP-binding protein|nr:ABC transporter ATP-binding protein [Xanthomonadales bacterium]
MNNESVALSVSDLRKHFGAVEAVRGLSLNIRVGECFGLLGPNGAGKTTTIELLEGILRPSSGTILYLGEPLGDRFRREAGIQFQHTALQDFLTVREHLELFARLYPRARPIAEIMERCALGELAGRDARKLSGGQRQRLLLGIALVHDPAVIFLDEPTTGLDPQARRNFWSLVESIKADGRTVVLTTHYMEEAYRLCDRIAIMDHGQIIADGTPRELLRRHFAGAVLSLPLADLQRASIDLGNWRVHQDRAEQVVDDLEAALDALRVQGVGLQHLQIREHTLEDLFIELTGEALRA